MVLVADSAPNRNEYQEYFLGGKGGRCLGLTTLPLSCADRLESESLNFLESSGPVQGLLYLLPWHYTDSGRQDFLDKIQ